MLKSGRILLPLNTSEPRFNHFIVYMYNFNTKNSCILGKISYFFGVQRNIIGFLIQIEDFEDEALGER